MWSGEQAGAAVRSMPHTIVGRTCIAVKEARPGPGSAAWQIPAPVSKATEPELSIALDMGPPIDKAGAFQRRPCLPQSSNFAPDPRSGRTSPSPKAGRTGSRVAAAAAGCGNSSHRKARELFLHPFVPTFRARRLAIRSAMAAARPSAPSSVIPATTKSSANCDRSGYGTRSPGNCCSPVVMEKTSVSRSYADRPSGRGPGRQPS